MGGNRFSFLTFPLFFITTIFWHEAFSMNVSNIKMSMEPNFTSRNIRPRALSGILSSPTDNPYFTAYISWDVDQYPAQWYTHIRAMFYMVRDPADTEGAFNEEGPVCEITVGDKTRKDTSDFNFCCGNTHNIISGENYVTHNDDGQKHVWLSATFYSDVNLGTFTVEGWAMLDPFYVYTITFNGNGGTASKSSITVKQLHTYGTLATATRTGYTFNGWYTASSGGSYVTASSSLAVESDHTLYAQWTANDYTVTFNGNGGTPSKTSMTVTYGSTYGTLGTATRNYYSFSGWYTKSSGGSRITYSTTVSTAYDHTLYARWVGNEYTVTFNGNGGTASISSMLVTYGSAYGTLATAKKTGYSFNGWYTKSSGGFKVTSSSTVSTACSHTLYAQWTVNDYTVTFNGNGGTASKSSKTVTYDSTYGTLATATRSYCTFNGWYTKSSGGSKITSSSTVSTAGDHTLYAHWTGKKYTVTFNGNGGTASISSMTVRYGSTYGTLATATKSHYYLNGWYTKSSGGSKKTSSSTVTTGDHTLYAHWTAIKYKITFNTNGGSSCTSITGEYGSSFTLPTTSRTGYTFNYWSHDSSLTTKYAGTTMPDYNFTLYAKWTANKYTVTFDGNGGTVSKSSMTVTYDSTYWNIATATKTGHTFNGWYTASSGGLLITVSTTVRTADDHTLYAQWTINSYNITFKDGNDVISSNMIKYMGTITYPPDRSKKRYIFTGWDSSITSVPDYDVTINAKWIAIKYFLIIEDEDGTVLVAGMFDYGSKLSSLLINKAGYATTFTTDEGEVYTTVPDYDVTLYVSYDIITYTMTFAYKNGTVICSRAQTYNSTIDFPTVKEEGYTFVGWRTNDNIANITTVPAASMLFYPIFTPNTYKATVVYNENNKIVKEFLYGEIINLTSLENDILYGFEVLGWYMDPEHTDKIINNFIKIPAFDINIYPYVVSNQVEIVLGTKGLSEKDLETIVKGYTDANFVIESFEGQKETIVIIKFNDANDANEFIEAVERGSERDNGIKKISFNFNSLDSFSQVLFALTRWFYLIL